MYMHSVLNVYNLNIATIFCLDNFFLIDCIGSCKSNYHKIMTMMVPSPTGVTNLPTNY
jgi:hypothetical protein